TRTDNRGYIAAPERLVASLCLLLLLAVPPARSQSFSLADIQSVFPEADSAALLAPEIPVASVRDRRGAPLGFIASSLDLAPIPGYSGKPIDLLAGLDSEGRIQSVSIRSHEEPILVIGLSESDLTRFLSQFSGAAASDRFRVGANNRPGYVGIDGISGATITAMILARSVSQTAQRMWAQVEQQGQPVTALPTVTAEPESLADQLSSWEDKTLELALTVLALGILLFILFFQDWIVRHRTLFHWLRNGFLLFSVLFFGIYCAAQLSVVNLLAFFHTLAGGFTWSSLLLEPVAFLLWGFVAVSIVLWGRGVYCGWLCPFGALQDLISKLARLAGIPAHELPPMVHERLWAIKYILLIALVGLSLQSMGNAAQLAEAEPFKTVFVLHFQRGAPFVAYALLILLITVINSKFYCKYLCSLGAGLSILSRFRTFDWLRRRRECGKPCQACASDCQIAAIKPTGEIIENECHHCLECQVTYWNDQRCPPLVDKRKKRERQLNKATVIAISVD
ncbi:MAG: 4Fe-4S binding protein, partial [Parahaliea sp.]